MLKIPTTAENPALIERKRRTLVMGIVNVTPDSFSDGGRYFSTAAAVQHALQLIDQGADILDIGGESTRPGSQVVGWQEEWQRIGPVLKELSGHCSVPISVDTYHAHTAAAALEQGATCINDVWGGMADPDMYRVVQAARCTYIWMHNRTTPALVDPVATLLQETEVGIERCLAAGVAPEQLWIDPGIGFGKTFSDNIAVLHHLREYCAIGYPVLLGTSRKRFIGRLLEDALPTERLEGSLATAVLGAAAGVAAVRVHDVVAVVKALKVTDAIVYA
ncbi:dihydropteroate synthase [Alicyclobacillaceae bacterium I2511]|nr:dihydropteroate synthase [Alicyclobacillaceae bacterium I2511]